MIRRYYSINLASEADEDFVMRQLTFAHIDGRELLDGKELSVLGHSKDPDRIHYFHVCDASVSYNEDVAIGQFTIIAREPEQVNLAKTVLERILERELTETK